MSNEQFPTKFVTKRTAAPEGAAEKPASPTPADTAAPTDAAPTDATAENTAAPASATAEAPKADAPGTQAAAPTITDKMPENNSPAKPEALEDNGMPSLGAATPADKLSPEQEAEEVKKLRENAGIFDAPAQDPIKGFTQLQAEIDDRQALRLHLHQKCLSANSFLPLNDADMFTHITQQYGVKDEDKLALQRFQADKEQDLFKAFAENPGHKWLQQFDGAHYANGTTTFRHNNGQTFHDDGNRISVNLINADKKFTPFGYDSASAMTALFIQREINDKSHSEVGVVNMRINGGDGKKLGAALGIKNRDDQDRLVRQHESLMMLSALENAREAGVALQLRDKRGRKLDADQVMNRLDPAIKQQHADKIDELIAFYRDPSEIIQQKADFYAGKGPDISSLKVEDAPSVAGEPAQAPEAASTKPASDAPAPFTQETVPTHRSLTATSSDVAKAAPVTDHLGRTEPTLGAAVTASIVPTTAIPTAEVAAPAQPAPTTSAPATPANAGTAANPEDAFAGLLKMIPPADTVAGNVPTAPAVSDGGMGKTAGVVAAPLVANPDDRLAPPPAPAVARKLGGQTRSPGM